MAPAHGRAGRGAGRRARPRGGVRVRWPGGRLEPGAAAQERQPQADRAEQPAEPVGRVREVGARPAGQAQRCARPVHHHGQVRVAQRVPAHRVRDRRHQQGQSRFPRVVRQRAVRVVRRHRKAVPSEEKTVNATFTRCDDISQYDFVPGVNIFIHYYYYYR